MKKVLLLAVILLNTAILSAQFVVQGNVKDSYGFPLIGVNVYEKGTFNGTSTDLDGDFLFTVSSETATLVFSYIGYELQEVDINGNNQVDLVMNEGVTLGEVQIVGSRSFKRSITESPAPIDVIDIAQIANESGRIEINQVLQYAAPSFNATKQSGSDGADHIDPASLRGLGPDQTLVLINGKRRHQSSLVNVFGTRGRGNTGTDLNAIPASAIKRIEVLRDGASAQYGSDAIAGVINIVLKDNDDGLTGGVSFGAHSTAIGDDFAQQIFDTQDEWAPELFNIDGTNRIDEDSNGSNDIGEDQSWDGQTVKLDLNYGLGFGDKGGYINFTTEYLTKERTLRPSFGWRRGYGSAAADQFQFMVNSFMPLSSKTALYLFGSKGDRATDAYAFTRSAPGPDGDDRTVNSIYPNGFTPHITSKIIDDAITAGVRHEMDNNWTADFSHSYGKNNFHYYITGTNNASLGAFSANDYDAGGHNLSMNVTSLDFSRYFEDIQSGLNIAFGTEFRSENFQIFAGEEGSYATYDAYGNDLINPSIQQPYINEFGQQPSGGSQGFPGYSPSNEVDRNRSNLGFYGDAELNVDENFLLGAALRFEKYSDFGNTFNYKLGGRYKIIDDLSFRATYSTGFRAPSLAQIHYNLLFNNISGNSSIRTLLASNTSTVAKAFGIEQLKEETANNISAGLTYSNSGFTATVDAYLIDVNDRIILTDYFDASDLGVGAEDAQFFVNGIDTRTTGIDAVLNYRFDISNVSDLSAGIAANFNNTEVENINSGTLNPYTFFGPFAQAYLEAAAPDYKLGANVIYNIDKWNIRLNYTHFSEVVLQDFQWVDSPATNKEEADALYEVATDVYESKGILDLSVGYQLGNNLTLSIGANNLLNVYPTQQFDGWTDQGGFSDSVQMGSDGMYLFGRVGFKL